MKTLLLFPFIFETFIFQVQLQRMPFKIQEFF